MSEATLQTCLSSDETCSSCAPTTAIDPFARKPRGKRRSIDFARFCGYVVRDGRGAFLFSECCSRNQPVHTDAIFKLCR